jgi:pimeloyl-ACP methyl ester carboxylesterase
MRGWCVDNGQPFRKGVAMKSWVRIGVFCGLCLGLTPSWASESLVTVPTRDGQKIAYWWMPQEGATATVILLSGGSGGIGFRDGEPSSNNFLIRSRELFRSEGLNVALLGNPSDMRDMDDVWRTSEAHRTDVHNVMTDIRARSTAPMWLVGTSRGTVSATALALALQDQLSGVVLTASITSQSEAAAVPRQAIGQLRLPVLIYHHRQDACRVTPAREADNIFRGLAQAKVKKLMVVDGGHNPTGNPCQALHWHGFIGMEELAVQDIATWMRNPQP